MLTLFGLVVPLPVVRQHMPVHEILQLALQGAGLVTVCEIHAVLRSTVDEACRGGCGGSCPQHATACEAAP